MGLERGDSPSSSPRKRHLSLGSLHSCAFVRSSRSTYSEQEERPGLLLAALAVTQNDDKVYNMLDMKLTPFDSKPPDGFTTHRPPIWQTDPPKKKNVRM